MAEGFNTGSLIDLARVGFDDFVIAPVSPSLLLPRLRRLQPDQPQSQQQTERLKQRVGLRKLIGRHPRFLEEIDKIPQVARCSTGVLIFGETGTGKELVARAIHYLGPRWNRPFIAVSCGGVPVELAENELFGHETGAFTGADQPYLGLVGMAHGGTLLLDDVDCLPPPLQSKLLRVLQEKEYRALGSSVLRKADIRVLAATNIDLSQAVEDGNFRADLFYRLNVVPFSLPSLRQRKSDIPELAQHFLQRYREEFQSPVADFSQAALETLLDHPWPGNVRELQNVIERAIVLADGPLLEAPDLQLPTNEPSGEESFQEAKARVVRRFERTYLTRLLALHRGNVTRAAEAARKNRRALFELIRKHAIDVNRFRPSR